MNKLHTRWAEARLGAVAAMLALRPATLYQWAYERRIPVVKLSGPRGPLRFRLSDIVKFVETHGRFPEE